jgi:FkbM family methyltransferase
LAHIRAHYHGGTFIDGGACIGNHTLFFAAFCADEVLAVEPVGRNMAHLLTNVNLSGLLHRVTPVRAALGREPGRGAMLHAGAFHGTYNLVEGNEIDVTTLDALMAQCRYPVTLVKLDIQWTEIAALEGATALLDRDHPALFIELMTPGELKAADDILTRFGYRRTQRFGGSPTFEYKVER